MFFDPKLTYSSSSNRDLGLSDEESENLRLRNLLRENILKVERENMEAIQKDILKRQTEAISKNAINNAQEKVSKVSANKSSVSLKRGLISLHAKSPQTKKDLDAKPSNLPTDPGSQNTAFSCPFSNVHFLNHFQSSYLASKPANRIKPYNEMEHFTSLDPPTDIPIQKYVPVQSLAKKDYPKPTVQNNKRIYKNLTVQALPSITINGEKTNFKRNILMEELKEKSHSAENCVKTVTLPSVPQENKIKFKTRQMQDNVANDYTIYNEKGIQVSGQPTRTVCTQSSLDSKEGAVSKEYVKELVKEVLEDFKLESYRGLLLESAEKESRIIPCRNDCELDSFIGNTTPKICDGSLHNRNTTRYTTSTQTSFDTLNMGLDKAQMKDLMKEIIHEYRQATPVNIMDSKNTQCFIPEVMVKETQTDERDCDSCNVCAVSKAVQVSLLPENPNSDQTLNLLNKPPAVSDSKENSNVALEENTCCTLPETSISSNSSPSSAFPAELSTRLEFVINSLYEHLRKDDPVPDVSLLKLNTPKTSVTTIETSLQLDPLPTSNKSICTDKIPQVNSAVQSDPIPPPQSEKKLLIHASVQSDPTGIPLQQQVDSSTQCDQYLRVASKDVCLQTFEAFHSEGSANTSVSSTPVSDSMFLDDMLSEGEVFLPWNLRLLSHSDKSQLQSSSNIATEDSCSSDKEKDYSLSEGEIPPNYFQQMNMMSSPYDSGSDSSRVTMHQSVNIPCQKSPSQTNPIGPSSTHYFNRCQTPSSSLSEGEVRNASTLSEGQIFIHSKQFFPKRPFTPQTVDFTVPSEMQDGNLTHQSAMCSQVVESNVSHLELSQKLHSSSNLSEGEIEGQNVPGIMNKPRGLFTLREEK